MNQKKAIQSPELDRNYHQILGMLVNMINYSSPCLMKH